MAKKSAMADAKASIIDAAKTGAEGVKSVAGEALGAAAVAAAGVVLDRVADAVGTGAQKVEAAVPPAKKDARKAVAKRFQKPAAVKKAVQKKKPAVKKAAPKKKPGPKSKAASKGSAKNKRSPRR